MPREVVHKFTQSIKGISFVAKISGPYTVADNIQNTMDLIEKQWQKITKDPKQLGLDLLNLDKD